MASPASRLDLLLGYLLGFIGFAMIQALVILGYAVWVIGVHIAGPPWLVLLTLLILVIGVVNLGIALSFYARNELQVVQFIPLIFVAQIFLGGLFWPVQTLWAPLRLLSPNFSSRSSRSPWRCCCSVCSRSGASGREPTGSLESGRDADRDH